VRDALDALGASQRACIVHRLRQLTAEHEVSDLLRLLHRIGGPRHQADEIRSVTARTAAMTDPPVIMHLRAGVSVPVSGIGAVRRAPSALQSERIPDAHQTTCGDDRIVQLAK